jgi:replicative DNA helicase
MADHKRDFLDKPMPSNLEAERLILGVILLDNTTINQAAERLKPEDFFLPSHRMIYEKMLYLYEHGHAIDPVALAEELRRAGELEQVGDLAYIASLYEGAPRFSNIDNYTRIAKNKSTLRRLISAGSQIINMAFDDEEEADIILDKSEHIILAIGEDRIKQGFTPLAEVAEQQLKYIEEIAGREQLITGIATGFADLDYMTSGMQRGDLIIVAARPSMGKCLAHDAEIVLEDGSLATMGEIYRQQQARLLTLGDDYKFRFTEPSAFIDDGQKPVFRVTTRLGRQVVSTFSHPYLTVNGWQPLALLQVGEHIAVPRQLPVFGTTELPDEKIKLLAYLLGDGNLTNSTPSFTNTNPLMQSDFVAALAAFPGLKVRRRDDGKRAPSFYVASDNAVTRRERQVFAERLSAKLTARGAARALALQLSVNPNLITLWQRGETAPREPLFLRLCEALQATPSDLAPNGFLAISQSSRNPLTLWLDELGIWGCDAHKKFIPALVFQLTKPQLALFLNRLFATDGWVARNLGQAPQLGFSTVSEKMARQIQHLLLRFGIIAKLRQRSVKYGDTRRNSWQLDITHGASIRAFAEHIGMFGKDDKLAEALSRLSDEMRNNRDLIPLAVWQRLVTATGATSWSELARRAGLKSHTNIHVNQRALSRQRLSALATALQDDGLTALARSDVYWDEIISIEPLGVQQVYDLTIPETHNFVANDVCVHNTAFCLNIAQNAALRPQHHGKPATVAVFSLEMSKEQLVNRMLCSQGRIDAHRLRSGMLNKDDWRRLAQGVAELSEAKIFLDDSPGINVLEMRAKCRRLKNEQKALDLIVIDYLQLMSGRGRIESRQQEVSQISRELKMLAKELNVPLIALSQLSRAPEARTGSRPQLSDLRESGCLTGDSLVTIADSGERVAIRDLVGKSGFDVWALDETMMQIVRANVSNAFATGVKPVFRLTTRLGRTIRATANHKFCAFDGWRRLDELQVGERLALPRAVAAGDFQTLSDEELALLGHLIGDGCTLSRHAIQYTTREQDLAEQVAALATEVFGAEVAPRIQQERTWYQVYLSSTRHHTHNTRSAVTEWLMKLDAWGLRAYEKRVPEKVFAQPEAAIGLFLRHLWATDGCIWADEKQRKHHPGVYYATSSERLAHDVQSLLLRLGINARLRRTKQTGKGRDQLHVIVSGKTDIERFIENIGAVGARRAQAIQQVAAMIGATVANANRDSIPAVIWPRYVKPALRSQGITARQLAANIETAYSGSSLYKQNVSRERAARIAAAIHSEELLRLAQSDIYWDEVSSIEPDGEEEVFDLTVDVHHNFIVNDIISHNSIEQDADVVMFIYREDYYKPETEKQNIAEIIIGKQRNGPVGSVELVFLKQLTRFEDKFREQ